MNFVNQLKFLLCELLGLLFVATIVKVLNSSAVTLREFWRDPMSGLLLNDPGSDNKAVGG